MLIFTRKEGQKIRIGDDIEITILDVKKGSVKIGIRAPRGLAIHREEVYQKILQENLSAARSVLNGQGTLDDTVIRLKAHEAPRKKE